ncbi:hypothetical protein BDK51DRAFT_36834, partial [Blyttiomyces helicus]
MRFAPALLPVAALLSSAAAASHSTINPAGIRALEPQSHKAYCSPSGPIQDACCNFETVEDVNAKLYPALDRLVKTSFFRYYK